MNLLLDTHVAVWATSASHRIPEPIARLLLEPANELYVSAASIWELAIKHSLRKRNPPPFSGREAVRVFQATGYRILNVTPDHAAKVDDLTALHGDPFDRLLIAQALVEPMHLVTHDEKLAGYGDGVISW